MAKRIGAAGAPSSALPGPQAQADLDRYAVLSARIYGKAVDAVTLIPHILGAYMAQELAFLEIAGYSEADILSALEEMS